MNVETGLTEAAKRQAEKTKARLESVEAASSPAARARDLVVKLREMLPGAGLTDGADPVEILRDAVPVLDARRREIEEEQRETERAIEAGEGEKRELRDTLGGLSIEHGRVTATRGEVLEVLSLIGRPFHLAQAGKGGSR